MNNEYLQEKVLGECVHESDGTEFGGYAGSVCAKCGEEYISPLRDFSRPKDYCALEDKMTELGEWKQFQEWHTENRVGSYELAWNIFQIKTRTQRAALIAEYWRQR